MGGLDFDIISVNVLFLNQTVGIGNFIKNTILDQLLLLALHLGGESLEFGLGLLIH